MLSCARNNKKCGICVCFRYKSLIFLFPVATAFIVIYYGAALKFTGRDLTIDRSFRFPLPVLNCLISGHKISLRTSDSDTIRFHGYISHLVQTTQLYITYGSYNIL